ncbi:MAG: 2-dehydropantoate 2-reductase N-terminal domain-containing protein [Candidatus Malihini olakiniferum]
MMTPHIAVVGAGAVGGFIGAYLTAAGKTLCSSTASENT